MARTAKTLIALKNDGVLLGSFDTLDLLSGVSAVDSGGGVAGVTGSGGGGGFTKLTATETPNGVLKIFTFSAASAQPSYVVADNTLVEATSEDGTVNWTWNSGTKKATMTIPPTNGLFGVV